MTAKYGAHEIMEVHETLSSTIDSINQLHLYRPHAEEPQLRSILEKQLEFMTMEYNNMVNTINERGMNEAIPYRATLNAAATYGLRNPETQTPPTSIHQIDDRDVASGILGMHKSSAVQRLGSALECADPQLRRMLQQTAINCAEQAYEIWHYMNQRGYYQVPTMKDVTTNTMISSYGTTGVKDYSREVSQQYPRY